jgi:membrane-associated phospholipid phosphatase
MLHRLSKLDIITSQILHIPDPDNLPGKAAAVLAHSADSWFWLAGLAVLWLLGPADWRTDILVMIVSIMITAGFVLVLKFTIQRPRPQGEWGEIYRKSDPHSFPSGHAARAALLTTLIFLFGHFGLGILFLIWTLLVSISRIALGVHYLSDILTGGLVGFLSGLIFRALSIWFLG